MSLFCAQDLTSISSGESVGYSILRVAKKHGISFTPILVGSLLLHGQLLYLTGVRSYKDKMGPVMGDAAHAVGVTIFQHLAPSFECPRAWCIFCVRVCWRLY